MLFTILNSQFLNEFYVCTKKYTYSTFYEIVHSILHDEENAYSSCFSQKEINTIIIINKAVFQNIIGFFEMTDKHLPLPAFNSLRSAVEATRLFRAFCCDEEFRKEYVNNKNIDFSTVYDYNFMQSKVNKVLDKNEEALRSKKIVPFSSILSNFTLTRGSALSQMHSELSKWSHVLNVNLLTGTHINSSGIYLGIDDEFDAPMQSFIKKYVEGIYDVVNIHSNTLMGIRFRKEYFIVAEKMSEMYKKYIELFY